MEEVRELKKTLKKTVDGLDCYVALC